MEPFAPWDAPAKFFARKMEPFAPWDAPAKFFARKMEQLCISFEKHQSTNVTEINLNYMFIIAQII